MFREIQFAPNVGSSVSKSTGPVLKEVMTTSSCDEATAREHMYVVRWCCVLVTVLMETECEVYVFPKSTEASLRFVTYNMQILRFGNFAL